MFLFVNFMLCYAAFCGLCVLPLSYRQLVGKHYCGPHRSLDVTSSVVVQGVRDAVLHSLCCPCVCVNVYGDLVVLFCREYVVCCRNVFRYRIAFDQTVVLCGVVDGGWTPASTPFSVGLFVVSGLCDYVCGLFCRGYVFVGRIVFLSLLFSPWCCMRSAESAVQKVRVRGMCWVCLCPQFCLLQVWKCCGQSADDCLCLKMGAQ
jgi:hypothetical protein